MDRNSLRFLHPETVLANPSRVLTDGDVVQVWPFLLEGSHDARARCEATLSAPERERARRFHHEHHRSRFIFAHGLMRHVLGAQVGVEPRDVAFIDGEFGKPALASTARRPRVSFNLSHSHDRALLAVSLEREVGVDIEREKASTNVLGISSSYFFGPEFDAIRTAAPERCVETFFRFWVAKEAVLKAQGTGLHIALDSFHVRFEPDLRTAHVDSLDVARVARGWFVRCLEMREGWHAAVAALSHEWTVQVVGSTPSGD